MAVEHRSAAHDGRSEEPRPQIPRRLSTRIVRVTMISIMIAEILIFVPSIANFRYDWLLGKVETVAVAILASGRSRSMEGEPLSGEEEAELLRALDAELIAVAAGGVSRLLARAPAVSPVDVKVDLGSESAFASIGAAFGTLASTSDRTMRVLGPIGDGSMRGEVVMSERPLRRAMLVYSRNILLLSLVIAGFAGLLVNIAINRHLLAPIRRMTHSMMRFAADPEDPGRVIAASGRDDEIGIAERELAGMQTALAATLRQQRHLADLGLAVSKINHDLRNTLASAQLVSDRLSDLPDPQVQRFAPTLIRSLDRALGYTRSVLAYGRAVEETPERRLVRLRALAAEVLETEAAGREPAVDLANDVPEDLEVEVDPDQFHRALGNLVRNALEALTSENADALVRRVGVSARREADGSVVVAVSDTGPGVSRAARERLFQAFRGSTRAGGTGLGLAIVAEIVRAHGGSVRLAEASGPGASFEIALPPRGGRAQGDATT